jgi:hypothetical protein
MVFTQTGFKCSQQTNNLQTTSLERECGGTPRFQSRDEAHAFEANVSLGVRGVLTEVGYGIEM